MPGKSDVLMSAFSEQLRQQKYHAQRAITSEMALACWRPLVSWATHGELSVDEFAAQCAEALACSSVALEHACGLRAVAGDELAAALSPFGSEVLRAVAAGTPNQLPGGESLALDGIHFYETFLRQHHPQRRAERGVYYTPRPLADYIVESVDAALRDEFGLCDGLADTATWGEMARRHPGLQLPRGAAAEDPFVRILDPAAGTGVFLIAVIERIEHTLKQKWEQEGSDAAQIHARWNSYVPRHLMPRLFAIELMTAPSVTSQLNAAERLAASGYQFQSNERLRFHIADTLLDPQRLKSPPKVTQPKLKPEVEALQNTLLRVPFTVVLGNPPFRGISSNNKGWVSELLRGRGPNGEQTVSYFEVDGQPLGERKHWLQDDYVKFIRYAQWRIEQAGTGIVGFVTNHGYLDNTTFRGMRQGLLKTFQKLDLLDLHGNRKKGESPPEGLADEGVFEVEQGVAASLFCRIPAGEPRAVSYRDAWGTRDEKLARLSQPEVRAERWHVPTAPHYLFIPNSAANHPEYDQAFPLNEVMPVNSTAVVTARDGFVVGFDDEEIIERMSAFRDEAITDSQIRERFFQNSRSTKYPSGDTRGWKLADARARMRMDPDWRKHLRSCLYRPFDRRVIYWADWMVDWPRNEVMRHLIARPNLALVARRQMPAGGPCNYFWVTDTIALDGLIRSDNRGSESVFPLLLDSTEAGCEMNMAPEFLEAIERRLGLRWCRDADDRRGPQFTGHDVFHYIYALFHAPTYRTRYADELCRGFPRVVLPTDQSVWRDLCRFGEELVGLHLLRDLPPRTSNQEQGLAQKRGYPKYEAGRLAISRDGPWFELDERVWRYRVGTYRVCRKWIRDRNTLKHHDLEVFSKIMAAISRTLEVMDEIDTRILRAGSWPAVFSA